MLLQDMWRRESGASSLRVRGGSAAVRREKRFHYFLVICFSSLLRKPKPSNPRLVEGQLTNIDYPRCLWMPQTVKMSKFEIISHAGLNSVESDLLGSDTSGVTQRGASSELDLRNISKLIIPPLGASNYNQTPIQSNGRIISAMDSRYRRYSLTLHEKHS
ncbi:hypothetical protein ACFX2A_024532 [Malus domestica]